MPATPSGRVGPVKRAWEPLPLRMRRAADAALGVVMFLADETRFIQSAADGAEESGVEIVSGRPEPVGTDAQRLFEHLL